MGPGTHVVRSYVSLQVARISEDFVTIFTREPAEFAMNHFVSQQVGAPRKSLGAMLAGILAAGMTMSIDHVVVQPVI